VADPAVWLALADGARRHSAAAVCPLLIWLLPESVRFLVIKQAPAARIRAILNRLYPGQISDNVTFILPAQPAAGNAMRIVLSRQYGFGSLMLWLVYFMGLFLVYILGSWLPTLVKEVGLPSARRPS
jgi:AAHS family 4-hydroxybenzoate transporter-like MFS transporter